MTALVLVAAAVAVLAAALRVRRYRGLFRLPVRRDDLVGCRSPGQAIVVSPGGFVAPPGLTADGQSAFLGLRVRATEAGRLFDPFVEVTCGEVTFRQHLERGAEGRRQLNLSPLFQAAALRGRTLGPVRLRGHGVRWGSDAVLATFAAPPLDGPVLVLAPHPDDAEIAAFGLYARRPSWVVTVTAGEHGDADLAALVPDEEEQVRCRARLRVWDSVTVPRQGAVPAERCLNLAYPDTRLEALHRDPARPLRLACEPAVARAALRAQNLDPAFQGGSSDCTWAGLVAELRLLLERSRPRIVASPHPLVDEHRDHVFTTVALAEAFGTATHRPEVCFLYVVHRHGLPLHPLGPPDTVISLPPWTDEGWVAESVCSLPLDEELRRAKYLAVDSCHDGRRYGPPAPLAAVVRRALGAFLTGVAPDATTFRRRAPRPNELYQVVSPEALAELVARVFRR